MRCDTREKHRVEWEKGDSGLLEDCNTCNTRNKGTWNRWDAFPEWITLTLTLTLTLTRAPHKHILHNPHALHFSHLISHITYLNASTTQVLNEIHATLRSQISDLRSTRYSLPVFDSILLDSYSYSYSISIWIQVHRACASCCREHAKLFIAVNTKCHITAMLCFAYLRARRIARFRRNSAFLMYNS